MIDGASLTVRREIAISGHSIRQLRPWFTGDQPSIAMQFDADGAQRLKEATSEAHRGETLALVLDRTVVATAQVDGVINGPGLEVPTKLDRDANERLASQLFAAAPHCLTGETA